MPPREETPTDQEVVDQTLQAELAKGTDRRVAEGRAKAAGVRAYRAKHGEPEREPRAPAAAAGDGGGAPAAAAGAAPAPTPAAAAAQAPVPAGAVAYAAPS